MKIRENVKKKYLLAVFAGAVILAAGGTAGTRSLRKMQKGG